MPPKEKKSELSSVDPEPAAGKGAEKTKSEPQADNVSAEPAIKPVETAKQESTEESAPPPKPTRPPLERRISKFSSNLDELKRAFPDNDDNLCRAILVAASNNLEAAFTGMLAFTDETIRPTEYVREQIQGDERLARKLAEQQQRKHQPRRTRTYETDYEPEYEQGDDLYDGFQKGLNETKQAVSSVWGSIKQRWNGELNDEEPEQLFRRRHREDPRSQWWPKQEQEPTMISTEVPEGELPKLPPRKPSRPSMKEAGVKSVNAFGDETSGKVEEQEPDAFFIGESDDDLASLTLSDPDTTESKNAKSTLSDVKPTGDSKSVSTKEASEGSKSESGVKETKETETTKERKNSVSAKDLLNKVKGDK